jgi:hypothetical protein
VRRVKVCSACKRPLAAKFFGLNPRRADGLDYRCKECLREQVKLSIRTYTGLPRLVKLARRWPAAQLASEIAWQRTKLRALEAERKRRG